MRSLSRPSPVSVKEAMRPMQPTAHSSGSPSARAEPSRAGWIMPISRVPATASSTICR